MNNENNVLPENFDGVFRFTNFTDTDFKAKWDGVEYTFPALKTTPLIIAGATPLEVQNIRKKFARELATSVFYESEKFKNMNNIAPGGTPALYTDSDIAPFVQRCLEPLPVAQAVVKVLPKDSEKNYRKDGKGKNISKILDGSESLLNQGSAEIE